MHITEGLWAIEGLGFLLHMGWGTMGGFRAEEWHALGCSELDHSGGCDKKVIIGQECKWRTVATAMTPARDDGGLDQVVRSEQILGTFAWFSVSFNIKCQLRSMHSLFLRCPEGFVQVSLCSWSL